MFLVVFVTLAISIIGLFAQVLSLQAAKMNNAQVGLMQTMVMWHQSATTLAANNQATIANPSFTVTSGGCSMTGTSTQSSCGFSSVASSPYFPVGYQSPAYSFNSTAFNSGGQNYVVTYVPKPVGTNDLTTQNGTDIGYTMNDLQRQFARSADINLAYGTVNTLGTLSVQMKNGAAFSYPVPTGIATGSFGIISLAQ